MCELETYRGVNFMKMKNDEKLEEELTCQFKTDMSNLINFESST